jgi:DNA invertase Pin-like site-specific DNA recombinase
MKKEQTEMSGNKKFAVGYYRVSTGKQEASGLGLESQKAIVEDFCRREGYTLVMDFTEVESGANDDRKKLGEAIEKVKLLGGILIVAKLDRMTRDLGHQIAIGRMIKFIAVDRPDGDELMLNIMGSIAQHERKLISQRTKAAMAAKKARGEHMGRPKGKKSDKQEELNEELRKMHHEKYIGRIECLKGLLTDCWGMEIGEVVKKVKEYGYRSRYGGVATADMIKKYIVDLEIEKAVEERGKVEVVDLEREMRLLREKYNGKQLREIVAGLGL